MSGAQGDRDERLARDPGTPLHRLVDLAARRFDLHRLIEANPAASPELREWIALVRTQVREGNRKDYHALRRQGPPTYKKSPLRGKSGCALAGCGCLALVFLVLAFLGGGAALFS